MGVGVSSEKRISASNIKEGGDGNTVRAQRLFLQSQPPQLHSGELASDIRCSPV